MRAWLHVWFSISKPMSNTQTLRMSDMPSRRTFWPMGNSVSFPPLL